MVQLFFVESMFSRADNASKVGFATLVKHLHAWGFVLIDCQIPTEHLIRLVAQTITRAEFSDILSAYLDQPSQADWVA
jgi:leucyl/phenylalanyl-tRNA--protein transferase